eukprot:1592720-Lingulodinium_polyedra.AAC.1
MSTYHGNWHVVRTHNLRTHAKTTTSAPLRATRPATVPEKCDNTSTREKKQNKAVWGFTRFARGF